MFEDDQDQGKKFEFLDTPSDVVLSNWLSYLWIAGARSKHLRIELNGYTVIAHCKYPEYAQYVSNSRSRLGEYFNLEIFWEGKQIPPRSYSTMESSRPSIRQRPSNMLTVEQMRSQFAIENKKMLERIDAIMFVHENNPDKGYPILAAIPDRFGEKRLNRSSVEDSIGRAVTELSPTIAVPRLEAIQSVAQTGETKEYSYEHFWDKVMLPFRFQTTVEKVSESEILVIVRDHPTYETGQKWFWENYQG